MFGGVYVWAGVVLFAGVAALGGWIRPQLATTGWDRLLDRSLVVLLGVTALQLVPLPAGLVRFISPRLLSYIHETSLSPDVPRLLPLAIDAQAAAHAWLVAFCCIATFWIARAIFARGGLRTVVTALAWVAVVLVIVSFAQSASGTKLIYGFWPPVEGGARPLGPFINRNHAGTWSVLALFLCFGCLQWRRAVSSPARGWSWRARLAHAVDGRSLILVLAVALLATGVAVGASRSSMTALGTAAAYIAWSAPRGVETRRSSLWTGTVALAAAFAVIAYADLDRLVSRVHETRQMGLAQRVRIWADTAQVIRDFPVTGVGAGNFSNAMRLYQTTDRTYYWNEAHNHYLQLAAEGGLLLTLPAAAALIAFIAVARQALRRKEDPLHWMRLGASAAVIAVAVQSIWETGLTLPANGMLAAVAAAILLHSPRVSSHAASRH